MHSGGASQRGKCCALCLTSPLRSSSWGGECCTLTSPCRTWCYCPRWGWGWISPYTCQPNRYWICRCHHLQWYSSKPTYLRQQHEDPTSHIWSGNAMFWSWPLAGCNAQGDQLNVRDECLWVSKVTRGPEGNRLQMSTTWFWATKPWWSKSGVSLAILTLWAEASCVWLVWAVVHSPHPFGLHPLWGWLCCLCLW